MLVKNMILIILTIMICCTSANAKGKTKLISQMRGSDTSTYAISYDEYGLINRIYVIRSSSSDGTIITLSYNSDGNMIRYVDLLRSTIYKYSANYKNGKLHSYSFTPILNSRAEKETHSLKMKNDRFILDDNGKKSKFIFDSGKKIIQHDGYGMAGKYKEKYKYDEYGYIIESISKSGKGKETYKYNNVYKDGLLIRHNEVKKDVIFRETWFEYGNYLISDKYHDKVSVQQDIIKNFGVSPIYFIIASNM